MVEGLGRTCSPLVEPPRSGFHRFGRSLVGQLGGWSGILAVGLRVDRRRPVSSAVSQHCGTFGDAAPSPLDGPPDPITAAYPCALLPTLVTDSARSQPWDGPRTTRVPERRRVPPRRVRTPEPSVAERSSGSREKDADRDGGGDHVAPRLCSRSRCSTILAVFRYSRPRAPHANRTRRRAEYLTEGRDRQ